MRKVALGYSKPRLMAGVMLAALLSACSSDVSRFGSDPFANPFKGSARFDPASTGSIKQPSGRDMRKAAYEPVSTASTTTQTLSNPGQSMPSYNQPLINNNTRGAVQGLNPSAKVSGLNPGSVAAANYPALAPVAQRSGSALSGASNGWTAVGGTPVTLGQGDTVTSLSSKYGVPASAILAVNGLSPSSQLSSGQQIMIPAYNAVQGAGGAKSIIQRPVASMPMTPPKPVERITEARQAMPSLDSAPARMAQAAPAAMPKAAGPARQVGAPVESEAERRAAAKLRELKSGKSAANEDDDAPVKKRVEAAKPASVAALKAAPKPSASDDDDEDEAPAAKRVEAPKAAPAAKSAETPALKAARADAEKARAEAAKARAEADKAKAEMEKAKQAKVEKAKAEKIAETQKAKAKKAAEDDVETTASIPTAKVPERAAVEPKLAAKAAEPKPAETASSDSFRWPAKGRVISGFGARGTGGANDGINIAVPEGTPVRAAEGGTVVHADDALKGYGKMVLVRHPNGYVSVYAHNGELNVKRGETVKRGQVIAHSGATGNVTAPQLHFELRKGSTPVDPTTRLAD